METKEDPTAFANEAVRALEEPGDRGVSAPALALPKGVGAIRGIDEEFSVNPSTGSASLSVPIFTSPGRQGFGPELSLCYDSGGGNGIFGIGWSLSIPSISRKTAKGLPRYRDDENFDTFILSGAEDLVPVLDKDGQREQYPSGDYDMERFRPRTEGLFARIERCVHKISRDVHWRSVSKENITSIYGFSKNSRIVDPSNGSNVFQWLLEETFDAKGNVIADEYRQENDQAVAPWSGHEFGRHVGGNRYIKRIYSPMRHRLSGTSLPVRTNRNSHGTPTTATTGSLR